MDKPSQKLNEVEITYIAANCHNTNKLYCETLGDFSQPLWQDTPEEIKQSAINGVHYVLDNPNVTSEEQHENWMKVKVKDGWIYGEEKDMEKKTHPCLVPYSELPKTQQFKDRLFKLACVNALVLLGKGNL